MRYHAYPFRKMVSTASFRIIIIFKRMRFGLAATPQAFHDVLDTESLFFVKEKNVLNTFQ